MKRREFFEKSFILGAAATIFPSLTRGNSINSLTDEFPRRKLGRTGETLPIIGFGGILVTDEEQSTANDRVARAYDRGINYFDVAPTYGNAEERLGPALKPYRNKSFLACKTAQRGKRGAELELHESLRKLKTDHFDLYQLHALSTPADVRRAFSTNGAMTVFTKAKQEGKVRFLGFSAHSEEAAMMAMDRYDFDTVLFPINFVCWYQGIFGPRVVARARAKGMGILALKALAHTVIPEGEKEPYDKCWYIPIEDYHLQDLALRFTLSQGTTAAIPPGEAKFFWRALDIASGYSPLTREEEEELIALSRGVKPLFKTR